MSVDRREFLLSAAALAAVSHAAPAGAAGRKGPPAADLLGSGLRSDFPRVDSPLYLNSAGKHPLGLPMLRAMERHLHHEVYGAGEDRAFFGREDQQTLKEEFGALINAGADEVAFVQSTSDGENIVVAGMDLARRGGNVVIDDLHFTTSFLMYKMLEKQGLELRIVPSKGGRVTPEDYERAIDSKTRLVSMALVSNINGYLHDAAGISDIAHAHGAYVYADMIQAVGAVPLDMRALGIDFAAASVYKWLMAERGFGLLYVRRELQGDVVATTRSGHRQVKNFDRLKMTWEALPGAARYETGNIAEPLAAATLAGVRYVQAIGVEAIGVHAARLTVRLQEALPRLGYASLTPPETPTPIVAFSVPDVDETLRRLEEADILVTVAHPESRMRVSVSVFNTDTDIDRLVDALA